MYRLFDAEPQEGKESESLDSVITFLKDVVSNEAKNAQKKLEQSDKALEIMERMRAGQWLTLSGSDAAAGAGWRYVAEQYQSAIEQNESCVYSYTNYSKVFVDDPPKLRYLPTQPCFRSPF